MEPLCQQHHISGYRRNMNVVTLAIVVNLVKIFALRIALRCDANLQQMQKVFYRAGFILPRILDPRYLFDLNHHLSNPF
jgi:hypothetical protein